MNNNFRCDNEIDLGEFINALLGRKKQTIGILLLFITIALVLTMALPASYTASAVIKIGAINEPLISKSTLLAMISDSQFVISNMEKAKVGLENNQVVTQNISAEDIPNSDLITIKVTSKDPEKAVNICNTLAAILVKHGSDLYQSKISFLEEQVKELEHLNEDNKKIIAQLTRQLYVKSWGRVVASPQSAIVAYQTDRTLMLEKIFVLKSRILTMKSFLKNDEDKLTNEKKIALLSSTIAQLEEFDQHYQKRINELSKGGILNYPNTSAQKELIERGKKYYATIEKIFLLKDEIMSSKDFEIIKPAVFSSSVVNYIRLRRSIIAVIFAITLGLFMIFLEYTFRSSRKHN